MLQRVNFRKKKYQEFLFHLFCSALRLLNLQDRNEDQLKPYAPVHSLGRSAGQESPVLLHTCTEERELNQGFCCVYTNTRESYALSVLL